MLNPLVREHAHVVFAYLFGQISKYEYRRLIRDKELAKEVWALVANNGYILCNCKLFVYALAKARCTGAQVKPSEFEIARPDVRLLKSVVYSGSTRFKSYTLEEFRAMESEFIVSSNMDTYIGKFISKKMRFLCNSYGLSREEIHADLQCAGMYALRKQYPAYKSRLHALNICKTAIQNSGQGLIEFWTRTKRNALRNTGDGFEALKVEFSVASQLQIPKEDLSFKDNVEALVKVSEGLDPDTQGWVSCAAGLYDPGFSFYLGRDNSDAVDAMSYDKYLHALCIYYNVKRDTVLNQLRRKL